MTTVEKNEIFAIVVAHVEKTSAEVGQIGYQYFDKAEVVEIKKNTTNHLGGVEVWCKVPIDDYHKNAKYCIQYE